MSIHKRKKPAIIIDEEFMRLLPPLDELDYCSLEDNILIYGCMNPLVLWNDILIDGHNRYSIVTKHDLPFNTISLEFNSRDEVIAWMIKTQIERRNLTPMQLTYYRGLHYNIEKKIHGGDRHSENFSSAQNEHLKGKTANKLSEQYRVSSVTIRRDAQIADVLVAIGKESQEAKNDILSGKTRISRKQLREIAGETDENVSRTASQIAAGTFELSVTPPTSKSGVAQNNSGIQKGVYRHYKGNEYRVIDIAKHSETLEDMVVYKALYGDRETWVRPLSVWETPVDVDGKKVKRFEFLKMPDLSQ